MARLQLLCRQLRVLQNTSGPEVKSERADLKNERDVLVTVPLNDGSLIYMIFIAPESEVNRFQPTYTAMLKSVQFK